MKLWVDDLRPPPDSDWVWAKTSKGAIAVLMVWGRWLARFESPVTEMSLDHDLGGDDDTRPVVLWMCEHGVWPEIIRVHSANPIGVTWLIGTVDRYAPDDVELYRGPLKVARHSTH